MANCLCKQSAIALSVISGDLPLPIAATKGEKDPSAKTPNKDGEEKCILPNVKAKPDTHNHAISVSYCPKPSQVQVTEVLFIKTENGANNEIYNVVAWDVSYTCCSLCSRKVA